MFRIVRSNLVESIATFCVLMLLISHTYASPLDISTDGSNVTTSTEDPISTTTTSQAPCPYMGACGWGVYSENKKRIKYFIRNTCKCSPQYGCLLDDDDLSLSAFIYKCKERKPAEQRT